MLNLRTIWLILLINIILASFHHELSDSILTLTKLNADWLKTDKYRPTNEKIILKKTNHNTQ